MPGTQIIRHVNKIERENMKFSENTVDNKTDVFGHYYFQQI